VEGVFGALSARNLTEFLTEFFPETTLRKPPEGLFLKPFLDTWSWTERNIEPKEMRIEK
jgi:hypothetical protein